MRMRFTTRKRLENRRSLTQRNPGSKIANTNSQIAMLNLHDELNPLVR